VKGNIGVAKEVECEGVKFGICVMKVVPYPGGTSGLLSVNFVIIGTLF